MSRYRKKPLEIEAIQYDGSNLSWHAVQVFAGADAHKSSLVNKAYIETLEGNMEISVGDYIIKGIKGEFYPCKPDIFEASYDLIPEREVD